VLVADEEWVSDADLQACVMERSVNPLETNAESCQRLLEENAPRAVMVLCQLMTSSPSDKVKLDSAKYVIDRVLGPVRDNSAVNADIANRKLRLAQNMSDQMGTAIVTMLQELGLDTTRPEVRAAAYKALVVAGGAE
jgi:hypothetical protein